MQSDVVKVILLGDNHATKRYLHRLTFGDELSFSEFEKEVDDSMEFPNNTHTCSYLLDNKQCYTLQFWEIRSDEDLQSLESSHKPDIFVVFFDISKRSSIRNLSSLQEQFKVDHFDIPLLVIASKLHLTSQTEEINQNDPSSISQVQEMARSMGSLCVECCPITGDGVQEAAHIMVHLAVYGQKKSTKRRCLPVKKKEETRAKVFFPDGLVVDPSGNYGMENSPKCPGVNVLASRCVEDLAKMKDDTTCLDVRFTFPDSPRSPIEAHQVILVSAAPELFQDIFTGTAKSKISARHHELFEKVSWPVPREHNSISCQRSMVEIRVCDKVPRHEFVRLVEFLYVGASIAELRKNDSIHDLLAIAKVFNLTELFEACENVLEGNEKENVMKASFVGGGKAKVLKELFFDKPLLDDLVFQVQGVLIYAHQAVIIARCRALADKIFDYRRNHRECVRVKIDIHDVSIATFKTLLEYLYTDDVQRCLKQEVLIELLAYATESCLPRLVTLCEYQLIVSLSENTESKRILDVFFVAKERHAKQLEQWCKSLMARNYVHFKGCIQSKQLDSVDKNYLEMHQWPQKCHLSKESSLIVHQYIADRLEKDTATCCGLL